VDWMRVGLESGRMRLAAEDLFAEAALAVNHEQHGRSGPTPRAGRSDIRCERMSARCAARTDR
jgi:hypothetical protein